MATSPAQRAAKRLGGLTRCGAPAEAIEQARRELTKTTLADRIREAVTAWPPLTPEDKADLAILLTGGSDGA